MDRTLRRNTLILIGSLATILVLYVIVYWLPQRRRGADMRSEIRQKRESIEKSKQQSAQLTQLNGEIALLGSYNKEACERIPSTLNVKEFLATVHSLGQQEGVTIANVTPLMTGDLIGVHQQPIGLTLIGRFHSIMQLIYQLETMGRLIELTDLDIRSVDKASAHDEPLEAKLTVKLFARPSKPSPPGQKNG